MKAWNLRNNTNKKSKGGWKVLNCFIWIVGGWCGSGRLFKKSSSDHATTTPPGLSLGSIVDRHLPIEIQGEPR